MGIMTKSARSIVGRSIGIWIPVLLLIGCAQSPQAAKERALSAGSELMKKGAYRRALLEFKNAVQATPRDAEAQYLLGNAYLANADAASAVAAYKRAAELRPDHAEAQRRLAQLMAVLGDRKLVEEAEQRLHSL